MGMNLLYKVQVQCYLVHSKAVLCESENIHGLIKPTITFVVVVKRFDRMFFCHKFSANKKCKINWAWKEFNVTPLGVWCVSIFANSMTNSKMHMY